MINSIKKDDYYIITIKPSNAQEQELLEKILRFDEKREAERKYWTIPKKKDKQMEFSDIDDGWESMEGREDELPFK